MIPPENDCFVVVGIPPVKIKVVVPTFGRHDGTWAFRRSWKDTGVLLRCSEIGVVEYQSGVEQETDDSQEEQPVRFLCDRGLRDS